MKYTFEIIALIALSAVAYPQQTHQRYLLGGDTVQRVEVSIKPTQVNLIDVVDSLSKTLPDGQWCLTSKADTLRCRCLFSTSAGLIEGKFTSFDAIGRGGVVRYYARGEINGIVAYWSGTGGLRSLATMKNGLFNGTQVRFNDSGRVRSVSYWYDGALISSRKYLLPRRNKLLDRLFDFKEVAGNNILRLSASPPEQK